MSIRKKPNSLRPRVKGYIASYLMYGIALLALAGAGAARMSNETNRAQQTQRDVEELVAQVESIGAKVMLCAAIYPDGDHGLFSTRQAYPAPSTPDGRAPLSTVTCPGSPGGALTLNQLSDGIRLPAPPPGFAAWVYEHTQAEGVRLRLTGNDTVVLSRLQKRYPSNSAIDGNTIEFTLMD